MASPRLIYGELSTTIDHHALGCCIMCTVNCVARNLSCFCVWSFVNVRRLCIVSLSNNFAFVEDLFLGNVSHVIILCDLLEVGSLHWPA